MRAVVFVDQVRSSTMCTPSRLVLYLHENIQYKRLNLFFLLGDQIQCCSTIICYIWYVTFQLQSHLLQFIVRLFVLDVNIVGPSHLHRDKISFYLVEIESSCKTKHHKSISLGHTVHPVWFLNCLSSPLSFRVSVKTFPTWLIHSIRYKVLMDVWLICQFCYFSVTVTSGSSHIFLEFCHCISVCFGSVPFSYHSIVLVCV